MTLGKLPTLFASLAALACIPVCKAQPNDLCVDPRIVAEKQHHCRSEAILFRADGEVTGAVLASIVRGYRTLGDVSASMVDYFLLKPSGELVLLGAFPQAHGRGSASVFEQLGYRLERAGGLAGTDPAVFYERLIEEIGGTYCMIYRMRPPFTGELRDCDPGTPTKGTAGYAPGIVTWREASQRACELHGAYSAQACAGGRGDIILNAARRDADGKLYYLVVSRRPVRVYRDLVIDRGGTRNTPTEFEHRTYHVDAERGDVRLVKQESMFCDGRTCEPVSASGVVPDRFRR